MKRAQDFRVYGLGLNVNTAVETAVETAAGRYGMPQLGPDLSIPRVMSGPRVTQHEKLAREADRDNTSAAQLLMRVFRVDGLSIPRTLQSGPDFGVM